ncbi:MAG: sulfite exporter TauE/SafE family protein [Chitinophagaceae bacterium]|nr:sulfite exporter TauE/SafE family protein [Chitinophagaceae bacterium]
MWYSIISGLGLGLLGSFHCIGMCGPIALSLPIYGKDKAEKLLLIVLYNLGRAVSYALLGAIFGYLGNQFFLFGYQQAFSITIGVVMISVLIIQKFAPQSVTIFDKPFAKVKMLLSRLLTSSKNTFSYFFIGVANGLLPCGLVYLAIGAAMATGSVYSGAALMFMFGLGTFPLMISLMIFGRFVSLKLRNKMRQLIPFFIIFTALVFILRGMNLGIPYLSPQLQSTDTIQAIKCHP